MVTLRTRSGQTLSGPVRVDRNEDHRLSCAVDVDPGKVTWKKRFLSIFSGRDLNAVENCWFATRPGAWGHGPAGAGGAH